ncbi:MAG TPA: glutamate 5-kinase [Saprospiraceae bacterium]|nr:glutamate 5-kinase [Saprospiraceae bacterium]
MYRRIVIKVGTNVLTKTDGRLDLTIISNLVDQIAFLKASGTEVILVSSGAVGAARSLLPDLDQLNKVVRRQLLSSVGQIRLLNVYQTFFANYDLFCAQVLATKEDFRDRQHYLNMKECLLALQRPDLIPIVNENDVIAIDELMFTDNDELAAWVASMLSADALFILTNVDGILTGHPEAPDSTLIPEIDPNDEHILKYIAPSTSSFGRGGMATKFHTAQKVARLGITTFIANGKRNNTIVDILQGTTSTFTKVMASTDKSNIKKWIAFSENPAPAWIIINEGAERALRNIQTVNSLLPVGILEIRGDFQKGDLLEIYNLSEDFVGRGLAQYDSTQANKWLGQKDQKPLIHYDHLLIGKY